MIKAEKNNKYCFIACPPRQPCSCRTRKYPQVDKISDDKFAGKNK